MKTGMTPEILALLTSLSFSAQTILVRLGLRGTSTFAGVLFSVAVACLGLWLVAAFFGQLELAGLGAGLYFVLSGFLSPALSWYLFFEGIIRVGMARAAPLTAVAPFFAALAGIIFFGERLTLPTAIGAVTVVLGVALISFERQVKAFKRSDLIYPLASAICFSGAMVLRKEALLQGGAPMLGSALATTAALALLGIVRVLSPALGPWRAARRDLPYLTLAGLSITIAYALYFTALRHGDLITISPIVNSNPLGTLIFGALFMRRYEQFTPAAILGGLCTMFGVLVLALYPS